MMSVDFFLLLMLQAIQIAILATVVRGLVPIVARARPHLAHALWAVVLIKCITPPIWNSSIGVFSRAFRDIDRMQFVQRIDGSWIDSWITDQTSLASAGHFDDERVLSSDAGAWSASLTLDPISSSKRSRFLSVEGVAAGTHTETSYAGWVRDPLTAFIAAWACGVIATLLLLGVRVLVFAIRLNRMHKFRLPALDEMAAQLSKQLHVRRRTRVLVVEGAIGPAVMGWIRPVILLPKVVVDGKSMDRLRPLLAHELIHVRRGDLWWASLQEISKCLWWFHPLVWTVNRKMTEESERSCDQETIASLKCPPSSYARCLLDVLEHKSVLQAAPSIPGIRPIDVTRKRMERIMHMDVNGCQRTPLWVWSLMLLLALAVLPGAVSVTAQDRDPASKAPDQIVRKDKGPTQQKVGASPAVMPKESIDAQGDSVQADSVQADQASEVLSLRVYEIKGVLEKLNQAGGDQQAAEKRLLGMLPCSQVDAVPRAVDPRFATDRVKTEIEGPRLYVDGDKLYVLDKEPIHRQVQSILEHGQQYGFEPVLIQASLMLIPLEKWSELEIAWGTPNRVHGQADDQGQQPSESPFAADVQADPLPRVAQRAPDIRPRVVANPNDAAPRSDDRSGLPLNPIRQASAATVIDENAALMVTFVDSDLTQKIIEGVPGSTVLSRPKVVTVNGRSATIEIGQLTPMVVDYKKVKDENGVERLEPIVQQVKLGTDMKLTPVVVDGRYVRLDFHLSVAWIGDRVPGPAVHVDGSAGLPPSAQARVASTIETALSVPLGANLAIGGLAMEQNGQPYRLLCMIRCDAVEPGDKPTP